MAIPYGGGGTFEVELTVDAEDEYTDCFKATCVLATRNDHTLSGDRSQEVKVPVSFVGQDPVDTDDDGGSGGTGTSPSGGSLASTGVTALSVAALAAALPAAGWVAYRKGRNAT